MASSPTRISAKDLLMLNDSARLLTLHSRRIQSSLSGGHTSHLRGRGMEFDEVRSYQPGDDTRSIDWRATARRGKPYTKLYREERERPVLLCVDLRASQFFATRGVYKSVLASQAAGLAAWSALQGGDRIGGLVFSEKEHREIKPRRGKSALMHFINQLVSHPAWEQQGIDTEGDPEAALSQAITRLQRVTHPGSLIIFASDFRHLNHTTELELARLSRHNDVVMIFTHDPMEATPPAKGHYWVSDGKDEQNIDTRNKDLTAAWHQRFEDHWQHLRHLAQKNRCRLVRCVTNEDLLSALSGKL